jgi:NADPH:quinone reductase-like Zn-dependent oxidoreductase
VGSEITEYKKGQEMWGLSDSTLGAFAEYLVLNDKVRFGIKPQNITFEEAASVPFGFHTALHFLNKVETKPGQSILIYGASGAVGIAAVQIAKIMGLKVSAVASSKNQKLLQDLGADNVYDYKTEEFAGLTKQFDFVMETVSKLDAKKAVELTKEGGILILSAGNLIQPIQARRFGGKKKIQVITDVAVCTKELLDQLKTWFEKGDLKTIIDTTYPLEQVSQAHEYVDKGHKTGNVVITIS